MDSCPAARRRSPVNEDDLLEDRFFIFQLIQLDLGLVITFCLLLRFARSTSLCMSDFDTVYAGGDKRPPARKYLFYWKFSQNLIQDTRNKAYNVL